MIPRPAKRRLHREPQEISRCSASFHEEPLEANAIKEAYFEEGRLSATIRNNNNNNNNNNAKRLHYEQLTLAQPKHLSEFRPEEGQEEQEGQFFEGEGECDEELEEYYMRLDTIEEEEDDDDDAEDEQADSCLQRVPLAQASDLPPDSRARSESTGGNRAQPPATLTTGAPESSAADVRNHCETIAAPKPNNKRPLTEKDWLQSGGFAAASDVIVSNSMRKFATSAANSNSKHNIQKSLAEMRERSGENEPPEEARERGSRRNGARMQLSGPLANSNRLISEQQARQQQALFRALAERQKLMEQLGAASSDLITSAAKERSPEEAIMRRRQRRKADRRNRRASSRESRRQQAEREGAPEEGVPLSAVDLSSMSDRMLDELLGQIASASSSSLSSNGDSLSSSELSSSSSSFDSSSCDEADALPGRTKASKGKSPPRSSSLLRPLQRQQQVASSLDAPNVIGVHEDERHRSSTRGARKCREAFRRNCDNKDREDPDDDDDDNHDLELLVGVPGGQPAGADAGSLSPVSGQQRRKQPVDNSLASDRVSDCSASLADSLAKERLPGALRSEPGESVEGVLSRMLEALNEIGSDEQEQLNELLERGFSHLEQLLNCSLTSGGPKSSTRSQHPHLLRQAGQRGAASGQQISTAGKLAGGAGSHSHQLASGTLSKDSDYGSDTQSADCFSQYTEATGNKWPGVSPSSPAGAQSSESPSPTSLAGSTNSKEFLPAGKTPLSPLAIELSFRLAESLHRLAGQQQQQQVVVEASRTPKEEPRRRPMKSLVMLNCSSERPSGALGGSASAFEPLESRSPSIVSAASSSAATRNMTPPSDRLPGDQQVSAQPPPAAQASQTPRRQFKTCLNINGSSSSLAASISPSPTAIVICKQSQPERTQAAEKQEEDDGTRVIKLQGESKQFHFERRRSIRSSLRRRPSLTGSVRSGETRPGSPVPVSLLQQQQQQVEQEQRQERKPLEEAARMATSEPEATSTNQKHQRQLQKALILAQKYNYSPAKLATSKLSAKLQLKELTQLAPRQAGKEADARRTINGHSQTRLAGEQPRQQQVGQESHKRHSEEPVRVSGKVQLDISYFAKSGTLTIHVIQCLQLAPINKKKLSSNPYVKLYLLPDRHKSGKRKSSCRRNELNPKFDEKFTFGPALQLAEFEDKVLWLSVWHKDRLGLNDFLGELLLPLSQVRQQLLSSELCQSTGSIWYSLSDRLEASECAPCQASQMASAGKQAQPEAPAGSSKRQLELNRQQAELADKLNELQRKAARLTSAVGVAPAGSARAQPLMRVSLGPASELPSSHSITGQLFVALNFVPEAAGSTRAPNLAGELRVLVKEARNIAGFEPPGLPSAAGSEQSQPGNRPARSLPSGPLPNPFCKCYLLGALGQRLAKQRTPQLKRTSNPRWDFECAFQTLKLGQLASQALEIQMFTRDSILVSNKEPLGGIRLCSRQPEQLEAGQHLEQLCSEREGRLWSQMMAKPNIWVYGELPLRQLRPLLLAKPTTTTS